MADYRVRIQLVAPPSNPGLPLAGVRVVASNLGLNAVNAVGGSVYSGVGTAAIKKNSLIRLTLRGPQDVLNNVPPITVLPLSVGLPKAAGLDGVPMPAVADKPSAINTLARCVTVELTKPTDTAAALKVRATISNLASTLASQPPPARELSDHFIVKGKDANVVDLSDEKDASVSALIGTGNVSRTVGTGATAQTRVLVFGGSFNNVKMLYRADHNDHVHVTLNPAQIGE